MNLPITSRIKRSPLLQTKTNNIDATASQTEEGADVETIVKGKEKTKTGDFDKNWDESKYGPYDEWIKKPENKAKEDKFIESKQEGTGEFDPDETVVTKGEDVTIDTKLYKKEKQDVKEPWEVRRSNRAAKIQGRAQRRSQNKSDKISRQLAKMDDADKVKGNKRYDKLMAKQTENSQELSNMKQGSYNVAEGRRSGKLAGSRFEREQDATKSMGDYTDPEQKKMAFDKAKLKNKQEATAAASGITTSQAAGADFVGANPFSQALDSAKAIGEEGLNYKSGGYTPFKMKGKSPAKLGPLAAIAAKAVVGQVAGKLMSPGKMRSGFKMKGYGKK
tara:strand:+ start:548 stop:1546 length:999 start_codon:yes stop_codon:yes gene_type:complete